MAALIHRDLAEIPRLAFAVHIDVDAHGRFHLLLQTQSDAEHRFAPRILDGSSCAEVTSAAAIAIAAISERVVAESAERSQSAAVSGEVVSDVLDASARTRTVDAAASDAVQIEAGVAAVVDVGLLPAVGVGAQVELALRWSLLRFIAQGALFADQRRPLGSPTQGGEFGLGLGAVLVCIARDFEAVGLGLCPGFELGSLSAEAVSATDPQPVTHLTYGPRVEVRSAIRPAENLEVVLSAGAVLALQRDRFVLHLEQAELVHRPAPVSLRISAGIEFTL